MSPGEAQRRIARLVLACVAGAAGLHALLTAGSAWGQAGLEARGAELYEVSCISCHGVGGQGSAQAPPLTGVGRASVDFMLSTGRMPIADPAQQPSRGPAAFPPQDIDALVAYVASLGPGGAPIPAVDPAAGDLALGRELYAGNCAACHGAAATGDAIGGGQIAPPLDPATARQIAEAMRVGPGQMPPFAPEVVDQRGLDSIARYVLFLRAVDDPGGAALGRVGPVAEGFIAWVVGLGLMIVAIRLAGSRR